MYPFFILNLYSCLLRLVHRATMNWRSVLVLLIGLGIMYLTSLLHEKPYPEPLAVYDTVENLFGKSKSPPDDLFLTVVDDFMYLTAVFRDWEPELGGRGFILQFRRPLGPLLSRKPVVREQDWTQTLKHEIFGTIAYVSTPPSTFHSAVGRHQAWLSLQYELVDDENVQHRIRVYYVGEGPERHDPTVEDVKIEWRDTHPFVWREAALAGSTPVNGFAFEEEGLVVYSRASDTARFRVKALPEGFSKMKSAGTGYGFFELGSGERGDTKSPKYYPMPRKAYQVKLAQLPSPPNTLRIMAAELFETDTTWHAKVSVIDNFTTPDPISRRSHWTSRKLLKQDFSGRIGIQQDLNTFMDGSATIKEHFESAPQLVIATSQNASSITIGLKFMFFTVDIDVAAMNPLEEWEGHMFTREYEVIDFIGNDFFADICGVAVNARGDILVLRTSSRNNIYVYKRGEADLVGPKRSAAVWDVLNGEVEEKGIFKEWKRRMVLRGENEHVEENYAQLPDIVSMRIWTVMHPTPAHFLFTVTNEGRLRSYYLEVTNNDPVSGFSYLLREKWHMYFCMSMVIFGFSVHEAQLVQ